MVGHSTPESTTSLANASSVARSILRQSRRLRGSPAASAWLNLWRCDRRSSVPLNPIATANSSVVWAGPPPLGCPARGSCRSSSLSGISTELWASGVAEARPARRRTASRSKGRIHPRIRRRRHSSRGDQRRNGHNRRPRASKRPTRVARRSRCVLSCAQTPTLPGPMRHAVTLMEDRGSASAERRRVDGSVHTDAPRRDVNFPRDASI